MSDINKKSNKKILKRFSKYLLSKKLKPQKESNEYQPYIYTKKSSKISEKKKIPNKSDTFISFAYS